MNNEIGANWTNSFPWHHGHDDKLRWIFPSRQQSNPYCCLYFLSSVQQMESKDAGSEPSQVQVEEEETRMEDVNRLPVRSSFLTSV